MGEFNLILFITKKCSAKGQNQAFPLNFAFAFHFSKFILGNVETTQNYELELGKNQFEEVAGGTKFW
jgi:hypothetical protein